MTKRIIPCLDVKDGKVVKGTAFKDLVDAGDPVELAARYSREGAHELAFLDISATGEGRKTVVDLVERIATELDIPFCVGGGIKSLEDIKEILEAGATRVSLGTAGFREPSLIEEAAREYGSSSIIVAIDAKWNPGLSAAEVYLKGGAEPTGIGAAEWARQAEELGAGEVLLTSIDQDGRKDGYDLRLTYEVARQITIPVIASGGAGEMEHFARAFTEGGADAALAASVFHFGKIQIGELLEFLRNKGIEV